MFVEFKNKQAVVKGQVFNSYVVVFFLPFLVIMLSLSVKYIILYYNYNFLFRITYIIIYIHVYIYVICKTCPQ